MEGLIQVSYRKTEKGETHIKPYIEKSEKRWDYILY